MQTYQAQSQHVEGCLSHLQLRRLGMLLNYKKQEILKI